MKMKNTIAKILAVLSLAAFSYFPAVAETGPERDGTGLLVGIGPAFVTIDNYCRPSSTSHSCDDSDIGFKLFANYRATKHFGIEGGWIWAEGFDFSGVTNSGTPYSEDATASSFYAAAEAVHTFKSGFGVFAKAGVNFWDYEDSQGDSADGTDPLFGVGVEYRNTPVSPLKMRAEWLRLLQDDVIDYDTDIISLSAGYIF